MRSFVKGNRDAVSRSAHNLGLVVLRVPVAPILDPLVLLQYPHHLRLGSAKSTSHIIMGLWLYIRQNAISVMAKFWPTQIRGPPLKGTYVHGRGVQQSHRSGL